MDMKLKGSELTLRVKVCVKAPKKTEGRKNKRWGGGIAVAEI